jgi:hypothetical protein
VAESVPKIVRYFLAAGFLIPLLLSLVIFLGNVRVEGAWTWILLIVWPTFVLTMSAEAGGGAFGEFFAFLISASANALVYVLVGAAVSYCYRRFCLRSN